MRVRVSIYLDSAAWVCVPGPREPAAPLVEHGDVSVSFSPPPGDISAEDARIARQLADRAAEYAADIERLSAANTTAPETGPERLPGIRRHEQGGAAGAAISGRPFSVPHGMARKKER